MKRSFGFVFAAFCFLYSNSQVPNMELEKEVQVSLQFEELFACEGKFVLLEGSGYFAGCFHVINDGRDRWRCNFWPCEQFGSYNTRTFQWISETLFDSLQNSKFPWDAKVIFSDLDSYVNLDEIYLQKLYSKIPPEKANQLLGHLSISGYDCIIYGDMIEGNVKLAIFSGTTLLRIMSSGISYPSFIEVRVIYNPCRTFPVIAVAMGSARPNGAIVSIIKFKE